MDGTLRELDLSWCRVKPTLVVIDLETTGLDSARDSIIQIAALRWQDGQARLWSSLVRPRGPVPEAVLRLTGLDPDLLAEAPQDHEVLPALLEFLGNAPIAGHNIGFDLGFLKPFGYAPRQVIDSLDWARIAFPRRTSYRLEDFDDILPEPTDLSFHDARFDVVATLALLSRVSERLGRLSRPSQSLLGSVLLHDWTFWGLEAGPLSPDTPLFMPAPDPGPLPGFEPRPLPAVPVGQWFDQNSTLSARHPGWQPRPGQIAMAEAVEEALYDRRQLIVEAGTGVGKSLAYLIPALAKAAATGERVVVSTHTLALQDQLWSKDVPEALSALGLDDMPRALLKGRSRYLCLLKAEDVVMNVEWLAVPWEDRVALASFLVFLAESESGERDDWGIDRLPTAQVLWERVQADADACAGARCKFAGPCFMRKGRRQAEASPVIVTNHALLLSSAYHGGTLPPYHHVVLDEAHRVPEVADQVFGFSLPLQRTAHLIGDGVGEHGILRRIHHPGLVSMISALTRDLALLVTSLKRLHSHLLQLVEDEGWELPQRLTPANYSAWAKAGVLDTLAEAQDTSRQASRQFADFIAETESVLGPDERDTPLWLTIARWEREVAGLTEGLLQYGAEDPDWVDWWETTGRDRTEIVLRRAPLHPQDMLRRHVWEKVPGSVVLTSATLTVRGEFPYMVQQLGLDSRHLQARRVESPFKVREQALLAIPRDMADPRSDKHLDAVAEFVIKMAARQKGRMLVLTTSRRMVTDLAERIRGPIESAGVQLLVQGWDGPARRLAHRLLEQPESVLLGTQSLWEGIDVPGPALSTVVVTRLPFGYVGDPLESARREELEARGQSAFRLRTLPDAVLRFQQGFGRLLRTVEDRGVVVVLDPRILPQPGRYGKMFVDSLPGPSVIVGDTAEVLDRASDFLGMKTPGMKK